MERREFLKTGAVVGAGLLIANPVMASPVRNTGCCETPTTAPVLERLKLKPPKPDPRYFCGTAAGILLPLWLCPTREPQVLVHWLDLGGAAGLLPEPVVYLTGLSYAPLVPQAGDRLFTRKRGGDENRYESFRGKWTYRGRVQACTGPYADYADPYTDPKDPYIPGSDPRNTYLFSYLVNDGNQTMVDGYASPEIWLFRPVDAADKGVGHVEA